MLSLKNRKTILLTNKYLLVTVLLTTNKVSFHFQCTYLSYKYVQTRSCGYANSTLQLITKHELRRGKETGTCRSRNSRYSHRSVQAFVQSISVRGFGGARVWFVITITCCALLVFVFLVYAFGNNNKKPFCNAAIYIQTPIKLEICMAQNRKLKRQHNWWVRVQGETRPACHFNQHPPLLIFSFFFLNKHGFTEFCLMKSELRAGR